MKKSKLPIYTHMFDVYARNLSQDGPRTDFLAGSQQEIPVQRLVIGSEHWVTAQLDRDGVAAVFHHTT